MPLRKSPQVEAFDRAISMFGSENRLAEAIGWAQQNVNAAVRRGRCSAEMAIAIQRATGGLVTANELRPELWRRAADVPVEKKVLPLPTRPRRIKRRRKAKRRGNGG
jgi:DNA-binding transcriptional regulator YdaS (Cro superfamily)